MHKKWPGPWVLKTDELFPSQSILDSCNGVFTQRYMDEVLKCDGLDQSCRALRSCGAVYYGVQGRVLLRLWMKFSA